MNITLFCCSPKQESSITLQTANFIQQACREDSFNIQLVGGMTSFTKPFADTIVNSNLIVFLSPLMQYGIPSQLMSFLDSMVSTNKELIQSKAFAFYFTGNHILDTLAIRSVKNFFKHNELNLVSCLSQNEKAILMPDGQNELARWIYYSKSIAMVPENAIATGNCNVLLLDASDGSNSELTNAISYLTSDYSRRGATVKVINLRSCNILPCLSCEGCVTTKKCLYQKNDDFEALKKAIYSDTNIIQFVGNLNNGFPIPQFKAWLDRHHQYGNLPAYNGIIWSYLVNNDATDTDISIFEEYCIASQAFNKDIYAGMDRIDKQSIVVNRAITAFNTSLAPTDNFYSSSMRYRYAFDSEELQNICPQEFRYYAKYGYYNRQMPNPAFAPIYNAEAAPMYRQARIVPYQMMLNNMMYAQPAPYAQPGGYYQSGPYGQPY